MVLKHPINNCCKYWESKSPICLINGVPFRVGRWKCWMGEKGRGPLRHLQLQLQPLSRFFLLFALSFAFSKLRNRAGPSTFGNSESPNHRPFLTRHPTITKCTFFSQSERVAPTNLPYITHSRDIWLYELKTQQKHNITALANDLRIIHDTQ